MLAWGSYCRSWVKSAGNSAQTQEQSTGSHAWVVKSKHEPALHPSSWAKHAQGCSGRQRGRNCSIPALLGTAELQDCPALLRAALTPPQVGGRGTAHWASLWHPLHHTQQGIILAGITSWVNRKRKWVHGGLLPPLLLIPPVPQSQSRLLRI